MSPVRPVFIFGVARSGTNLLARALDAHPACKVALDPLMPLFKAWRNAATALIAPRLSHAFNSAAPFQDYYFDPDGPVLLDAILDADPSLPLADVPTLRQLVRERGALESAELASVFADWKGNTPRELVADGFRLVASWGHRVGKRDLATAAVKEVWTLEFAPALARAFPEARFLIIHRDPRAVLSSLIELARRNPDQAAHTVSYMRHWRKHVAVAHRLIDDPALSCRFASVRFEDLVARPKTELAAIYEFLGLTVFADLSPAETSRTWLSNSSFAGAGAGIDIAAADRWRTYLSPDVIAAVDYHCGPEMRLLGYQPLDPRDEATDGVLRHVQEAHRRPGKWRSDASDPTADMAWEARRREILNGRRASNAEVRRCFLFENVLRALADVPASTQKVSL